MLPIGIDAAVSWKDLTERRKNTPKYIAKQMLILKALIAMYFPILKIRISSTNTQNEYSYRRGRTVGVDRL